MAEGGQDEDSGDVMLAGAAAATTNASTASKKEQDISNQPIALNIKSEVRILKFLEYYVILVNIVGKIC